MTSFSLTGGDTITINLRPLKDLADDDITTVSFPNEICTVATGKNRNTVYALNESGNNAEMTIRVLMNSSDDKFLNGLLAAQQSDLPSFTLITGSFTKRVGDGNGKVSYNTYPLQGGVFTKLPDVKDNVNGDKEQAIITYNLKFALAPRVLA